MSRWNRSVASASNSCLKRSIGGIIPSPVSNMRCQWSRTFSSIFMVSFSNSWLVINCIRRRALLVSQLPIHLRVNEYNRRNSVRKTVSTRHFSPWFRFPGLKETSDY
jgi:hypothetical protein